MPESTWANLLINGFLAQNSLSLEPEQPDLVGDLLQHLAASASA